MGRVREFAQFIEEVQEEVKRVTWPDAEQVRNATIVILIFVIILAAIIGLMDVTFSGIVRGIVGVFSG